MRNERFEFLHLLTPSAIILRASISKPESVSSKIPRSGSSVRSCNISFLFFHRLRIHHLQSVLNMTCPCLIQKVFLYNT